MRAADEHEITVEVERLLDPGGGWTFRARFICPCGARGRWVARRRRFDAAAAAWQHATDHGGDAA